MTSTAGKKGSRVGGDGCPTLRFLKGGIPRYPPSPDLSLTGESQGAEFRGIPPLHTEREKDGAPGLIFFTGEETQEGTTDRYAAVYLGRPKNKT